MCQAQKKGDDMSGMDTHEGDYNIRKDTSANTPKAAQTGKNSQQNAFSIKAVAFIQLWKSSQWLKFLSVVLCSDLCPTCEMTQQVTYISCVYHRVRSIRVEGTIFFHKVLMHRLTTITKRTAAAFTVTLMMCCFSTESFCSKWDDCVVHHPSAFFFFLLCHK